MSTNTTPVCGQVVKAETSGGIPSATDLISALKGATALLEKGRFQLLCPSCQHLLEPAHAFCPACGALQRFNCPRCKGECRKGQEFCPACGFQLTSQARAEAATTKARDKAEEQEKAIDLLEPFTDVEKLSEERCIKMRVRHRQTGELRFLKRANSAESKTFLQNEASVLKVISHPHLIKLHQVHEHRDQMLLEFEHVQAARLRFPLDIERLCRIMLQVAEVLAVLHERGLVHCDIKPQNVLFRSGAPDHQDAVVLCDLEFAQAPGPSLFKAMTPLFSAPEQIIGDHIDARADVYAFGVMFYLWFFYDRLPSIVDAESSSHRAMGNILGTASAVMGTPLADTTILRESVFSARTSQAPSRPSEITEGEVLGAKYHFSAELDRLTSINKRLDLTGHILQLVSDTTELDPCKRPADGRALMARIESFLH